MGCTWLSIRETATHLNVHHTTVRKLIKQGKLPARRISEGVIRLCLEDVNNVGEQRDADARDR